jgi:hypothetical protein
MVTPITPCCSTRKFSQSEITGALSKNIFFGYFCGRGNRREPLPHSKGTTRLAPLAAIQKCPRLRGKRKHHFAMRATQSPNCAARESANAARQAARSRAASHIAERDPEMTAPPLQLHGRLQKSLRQISGELEKAGYTDKRGQAHSAAAVRSMIRAEQIVNQMGRAGRSTAIGTRSKRPEKAKKANGKFCGQRVTKLYDAGRLFASRHCYRLAYASQHELPRYCGVRRAPEDSYATGR